MRADSSGSQHDWLDAEAGPVVRPYTVTGGRVRPTRRLDLVAFVVAAPPPPTVRLRLQPEHRMILERSRSPVSVAELASGLDLALGVLRILLSDLLTAGLVVLYEPAASSHSPDDDILKAVVNGLRAL